MNLKPGDSIELWRAETIPSWNPAIASDRPSVTAYPVQASRGTVLVVPGIGYDRSVDREKEPVARWLNSLGLSAFVLEYRVAPYRYPVPGLDCRRALRLLRTLLPGRIGVLGFSAGGHLAGTVAALHDARALAAAGVPFELHMFARGGYGLLSTDLVPETARWCELCAAWLLRQVG